MKIIFLDIDGVLNGYGFRDRFIMYPLFKIFNKLGKSKEFKSLYDVFGIHERKIKNLSMIISKTDAKVVISSSWRGTWYEKYEKTSDRNKRLHDLISKYNIQVIGITGKTRPGSHRALEIKEWLQTHKEFCVESFVILDDEKFDFLNIYPENLVLTSNPKINIVKGYWYENTGLKRKHVKEAISILNKNDIKRDLLFLDIDGVLNNMCYMEKPKTNKNGVHSEIDRSKLYLLKKVKEQIDFDIVLTSTWKQLFFYNDKITNDMRNYLIHELADFGFCLFDITQDFNFNRPKEIYNYLQIHRNIVNNYVILDDDFSIEEYMQYDLHSHLIQTSFYKKQGGLRAYHLPKIIKILKGV